MLDNLFRWVLDDGGHLDQLQFLMMAGSARLHTNYSPGSFSYNWLNDPRGTPVAGTQFLTESLRCAQHNYAEKSVISGSVLMGLIITKLSDHPAACTRTTWLGIWVANNYRLPIHSDAAGYICCRKNGPWKISSGFFSSGAGKILIELIDSLEPIVGHGKQVECSEFYQLQLITVRVE